MGRPQTKHPIDPDAEHPIARALSQRSTGDAQGIETRSVAPDHPAPAEPLAALGMHSALIVPLIAGARVLGVITYANHNHSRSFDSGDLALAAEIGARAGLAVENARLATRRPRSPSCSSSAFGRPLSRRSRDGTWLRCTGRPVR